MSSTFAIADLVKRTLNKMIKSGKSEIPVGFHIFKALVKEVEKEEETTDIVQNLFFELEKPSSERRICVLLLLDHFFQENDAFRSAVENGIQILRIFARSDRNMFPPAPRGTENAFLRKFAKNMAKQMIEKWVEKYGIRLDQNVRDAPEEGVLPLKNQLSTEEIERQKEERAAAFEEDLEEFEQKQEEQKQFVHDFFMNLHNNKISFILSTIDRAYVAMDNFSMVCGKPKNEGGFTAPLKETAKNRKVIEAMRNEREILAFQVGIYRTYYKKLERFGCAETSIQSLKLTHSRIRNVLRLVDQWLPKNLRRPEEPIVMIFDMEDSEEAEEKQTENNMTVDDDSKKTTKRSQRKRFSPRDPNYAYYPISKKFC